MEFLNSNFLFTSAQFYIRVFTRVGLFVFLFVCVHDYAKTNEHNSMRLSVEVRNVIWKNLSNFGSILNNILDAGLIYTF